MLDQILLDDLNIELSIDKRIQKQSINGYVYSKTDGLKYYKIKRSFQVNGETTTATDCFVNKENGDILQAYKDKPSRKKIGNIFDL